MGALKSSKCARGHLLNAPNLYVRRDGTRECRKCSRTRAREWRTHKKGAKE